jgi:hypothetical protein
MALADQLARGTSLALDFRSLNSLFSSHFVSLFLRRH